MTTVKRLDRVANCENVSERDPWEEAWLAVTKPGPHGIPDVVYLSEVAWLDGDELARRAGVHALQRGERGSPEAGVALVSRRPIHRPQLVIASRAAPGVRDRPLVGGRTHGRTSWSGHAPPPDNPAARQEFIDNARRRRGLVGCDWNRDPEWMREHMERQYRGVGVLGLLIPVDCEAGPAAPVPIRSDHYAADVPVRIPRRR